MKRPTEIRTPPRGWLRVLEVAYPLLRDKGLGDLLLFGSQALSVYMETPLRSKDLDLVSSQIGPRQHEVLSEQLSKTSGLEVRSSTVQSKPLLAGMLKTYSVELRLDGRPFFVEVFDKILDGRSPSILAQHTREKKKWGLQLWVPTPSMLAALRLCFRPPRRNQPTQRHTIEPIPTAEEETDQPHGGRPDHHPMGPSGPRRAEPRRPLQETSAEDPQR